MTGHRVRSTLTVLGLTAAFWSAGLRAGPASAAMESKQTCESGYGQSFAFDRCDRVRLPGIEISFRGVSNPHPGIPLACWNYEVRKRAGAPVKFQKCSTGDLGGHALLSVADQAFTVLFDVDLDCTRLGIAVYRGELDTLQMERALARLARKNAIQVRCLRHESGLATPD